MSTTLLLFLVFLPGLLVFGHFIAVLLSYSGFKPLVVHIVEPFSVIVLPMLFLYLFDFNLKNDCCGESAFFSPYHRASIYSAIAFCIAAYFFCSYRTGLAPPLVEVVLNCLLLIGISLNVLVIFQQASMIYGSGPIIALFLLMLARNHRLYLRSGAMEQQSRNRLERVCRMLLGLPVLKKHMLLLVICVPALVLIAAGLMLFGQRPDAMIRAFTDTYHHGLSQLNHECDGVICGGHYLCTVAARGDRRIVRPLRYGQRHGDRIICNRQLLVANAFEELIQRHIPRLHRWIRARYDRVGDVIMRNSRALDRPLVSTSVYMLMKPLEWFFVAIIYLTCRTPEDLIALQYVDPDERRRIEAACSR